MADIILDKLHSVLTEKNKISPDSLITGKQFLKINGTAVHLDPSLVDATNEDIEQGYTFYNNEEQLVTGTNTGFNGIEIKRFVVNKAFLYPEINVNNKFKVWPYVEAYRYQDSSTSYSFSVGYEYLQVLDSSMFNVKVLLTYHFYVGDTLINSYDIGLYYFTFPSDLNRHGSYLSASGSFINNLDFRLVDRIEATYRVYNP